SVAYPRRPAKITSGSRGEVRFLRRRSLVGLGGFFGILRPRRAVGFAHRVHERLGVEQGLRDVADLAALAAGPAPQPRGRLFFTDSQPVTQNPLGPLDDDAVVEPLL